MIQSIKITKYTITAPVSGSKKVNMLGISVIIKHFIIKLKSHCSLFLFLLIISAKNKIKLIFMNSLG